MDSGVQQFLDIDSMHHDGAFLWFMTSAALLKSRRSFRFYGMGFCCCAGQTGVNS
jgi:hypothetical protein